MHLSLGFHLNSGKKCSIFGKDLFFGIRLNCLSEQNRGRSSSFPMLKIGQNWGKTANYPPNAQQRSALLVEEPPDHTETTSYLNEDKKQSQWGV